MPKKKKEEKIFDGRIWPFILEFNVNLDAQLISKSNFIFGASTLILLFIIDNLTASGIQNFSLLRQLPLIILMIGSFISAFLSMMVILPKLRLFSSKERKKEDVFYYKNILKFYTRKEYIETLKNLPKNNKKIGEAYANQVYSLATHILPYKFKMLKISGWILIISLFLSLASYLILLFSG